MIDFGVGDVFAFFAGRSPRCVSLVLGLGARAMAHGHTHVAGHGDAARAVPSGSPAPAAPVAARVAPVEDRPSVSSAGRPSQAVWRRARPLVSAVVFGFDSRRTRAWPPARSIITFGFKSIFCKVNSSNMFQVCVQKCQNMQSSIKYTSTKLLY